MLCRPGRGWGCQPGSRGCTELSLCLCSLHPSPWPGLTPVEGTSFPPWHRAEDRLGARLARTPPASPEPALPEGVAGVAGLGWAAVAGDTRPKAQESLVPSHVQAVPPAAGCPPTDPVLPLGAHLAAPVVKTPSCAAAGPGGWVFLLGIWGAGGSGPPPPPPRRASTSLQVQGTFPFLPLQK